MQKYLLILFVVTFSCGPADESEDIITIDLRIPDAGDGEDTSNSDVDVGSNLVATTYLSPTQHLVRASIAVRGIRPSVEELQRVHENPDQLRTLVESFVETPEFGRSVRELHANDWKLRAFFFMFPPLGEFAGDDWTTFNASVFDQPLHFVEHVVMDDKPYTEIVTADYTVADQRSALVWGMDYDANGPDWQVTHFPEDGRIHAGLLTESMVWIRHYSTPLNAQRSRANQVSKALLCYDFLDREVNVDGNVDLSDPEAVNNAVQDDPACRSCHQSLDPLANLFWTTEYFTSPNTLLAPNGNPLVADPAYPISVYRPEYDTQHRPIFTNREKGYFGKSTADVGELGQQIARDPRFAQCTVRRFFSFMTQVPVEDIHDDYVRDLATEFELSNFNAKKLTVSIVMSDAFRVLSSEDSGLPDLVKLQPTIASSIVEELAGFRWTMSFPFPLFDERGFTNFYAEEADLLRDDLFGYLTLGGGIDGFIIVDPQHEYSPSAALVFRGLANHLAGDVVGRELDAAIPERRLLSVAQTDSTESEIQQQIVLLHAKIFGELVDPDSASATRTLALFNHLLNLEGGTPKRAWEGTVSAMLQSPKFLYY